MARAGTQRWRNPAPEGDDVQRSIELLDKVLSEYDEHEVEGGSCVGEGGVGCGGGGGGGGGVSSTAGLATDCSSSTEPSIGLTPDDESPSLGHQSEDDGYMSMNGRKAKMALVALRPVPDCPEPQDPAAAPVQEFPPPPEEAERIISTLLPMVSPGNSTKRSVHHHQQQQQQQQQQLQQQQREQPTSGQRRTARGTAWTINMDDLKRQGHAAVTTQTTLPKTRHQRPYGWENGGNKVEPFRLAEPPSPPSKFASLPYDGKVSFNWVPARANPGGAVSVDSASNASNKRRQSSEDGLEDLRQSSEDGLDEEDEVDDEDADGDEEGDDDDDDDDDDAEDQSNRPSPDKERSASAAHNSHHHHHYHHPGSRRPPRQNEIIKSSSVEDRLLMNHNGPRAASSSSRNHNGGMATSAGCSERSASARRRRNNSDSSEGRFSRNSESERSSMPRSSSVSVERFSMRANCDSSDFSRANSMSNERFHSDFSIAMASASSNDHVSSVPSVDPFSIRNLDFVSFNLPHADSSERFSAQTSDREERYSEIYSTRNSDFSTRNSTDFRTQSEEEHFSDDSLEELLPPPPALSKRHSIAWEVSLEEDIYVPGSTKVVGRRRRKSSDVSSVGSASKLRDFDDWQDPRVSTTDDDLISPYSDSSTNDLDNLRPQDLSKSGTYVIRRGRKKERKILPKSPTKSLDDELEENRLTEVRRFSNTFDNIKSLLKENKKLEGLKEPPSEFANAQAVSQPDLVSVVSITHCSSKPNEKRKPNHVEAAETHSEQKITRKITSSLENGFEDRPLPDSPDDSEPVKITSFAEKTKECNGITITTSKSLDVSKAAGAKDDVPSRRSVNNDQYHPQPHPRFESKIPVDLLIEGEIVKKALNENRRQLEKVSDAIKEIESVKNSGGNFESDSTKRWRNGSSKRNSFDSDSCERRRLEAGQYDNRQVGRKPQQPPPPPPHAVDVTDATNKSVTDVEFDRRRLNGGDVYSSGRRRTGDLENHKNDTKQIENVIDAILEDSKNPDFQVSVEVLEFPPLPPSPVEEADEESSDVGGSGCNGTATASISVKTKQGHANRSADYRPRVPPHRGISLDSSKDHHTGSLNTRSMDAAYARRRRMAPGMANRREVPVERRTLPTDLPGPSHRRPFSKRHSPSTEACSSGGSGGGGSGSGTVAAQGSAMQTSCSLPETPVFARGSDIPRTPQHASGNPTQPRRQPGWYAPATATTGYRRNNPGLEQAIIGTELLRLAGGPNRGWYPTRNKSNQPRPASIEHLERLNSAYEARLPGAGEQRKPLTLPTNITPNKYFGQSKHTSTSTTREALRRVTSLLIKKGGGSKDGKNGKDNLSPSGPYAVVAGVEASEAPKKKGFFKNFWKRSRHYSLENQ